MTRSSWRDRKDAGDAHERRVAHALVARNWSVSLWGQGILTENVRAALRGTESGLRWTPDLVAARSDQIALVDCKSRMSPASGRHAVERRAVAAHLQLTAMFHLAVYYVFDDLGVLTAHDVMMRGIDGPRTSAGSGAAYYLVPASQALPFDDVFGGHGEPTRPRAAA